MISSVAISHDSKYSITGSADMKAIIWDIEKGTIIHTLDGHQDRIKSVAFSHDSKYAITGSYDMKAIIWDVEKGTIINNLDGH